MSEIYNDMKEESMQWKFFQLEKPKESGWYDTRDSGNERNSLYYDKKGDKWFFNLETPYKYFIAYWREIEERDYKIIPLPKKEEIKRAKFSNEHIVEYGNAIFYACILDDLRIAAKNVGWALGLHGSLVNDMDLMAMPWTEDAKSMEELIKALSDCFTSPFQELHNIPHFTKPNNRVVYTINIWADFYLDINIINTKNSQ